MSRLRQFSLLSVVLFVLTACEYKELDYATSRWATLTMHFDWSKSPEAAVKGMTALFFSDDDAKADPVRYDFAGHEGGQARLALGSYHAIAYNYDTETILYRNTMALSTLEAYTRESSIEEGTQLTRSGMPRAVGTEEEMVILEPDSLWADASGGLLLASVSDNADVTLVPTERVRHCEVTIKNVPNLQYTGQFGGALSGLSPGVLMANGQLIDGCVTQAFPCQVVDGSSLFMTFRIFGHCPHQGEGISNRHLLTIYAILADGSKWYYTQDVTSQVHNTSDDPDVYHINIELDGLPVPKPIVNGSGFQPTVDGWQGIEIPVGM